MIKNALNPTVFFSGNMDSKPPDVAFGGKIGAVSVSNKSIYQLGSVLLFKLE
jgi:hypothetical protein